MKLLLFLLLIIGSDVVFGQSAKKMNQQLLEELALEQQKQDSASFIFSKSYDAVIVVKEQLMMKSKELQKEIKTIRRTNEDVRQVVNLLGMLGENVDASKLNKYGNLPDSVNKLKPIENLMKTIESFERVSKDLSLEGVKLSEQNELLKERLVVYRKSTQENELRLQRNNLRKDQMELGAPQVDSVISMLKRANHSALDNKKDLDKQVEALKENYRLKGPNGFSSEYQRLFPDIHPVAGKKTTNSEPTVRPQREDDNPFTSDSDRSERVPMPEKVDRKEPEILDLVDEPAEFPGGHVALLKYLAENIRYPEIAKELGVSGKHSLQFVVNENGYISNVKVTAITPNCPECDAEVIRVVKAMPNWIPAKNNGKAVKSWYSLPINIELD